MKNCGILEGKGGYKCEFCKKQMSERFDWLKEHLKKCKEKPDNFDQNTLKSILKIKQECEYCHSVIDLAGGKRERHLKTCKGRKENEGGVERENRENMNQKQQNNNNETTQTVDMDKETNNNQGDISNVGECLNQARIQLQKVNRAFQEKEKVVENRFVKMAEMIENLKNENEELKKVVKDTNEKLENSENKNIILEKELEKMKIELDTKCFENNDLKTKLREIRKEKEKVIREGSQIEYLDMNHIRNLKV